MYSKYIINNEKDTHILAERLACLSKKGDIILIHGILGSGKSVFCRAFIRKISSNPFEIIPSPTFTLVQTYECTKLTISHFDLYRITHPDEIHELCLEEAFENTISLIEWPNCLQDFIPKNRLDIYIKRDNIYEKRIFYLKPYGIDWEKRILILNSKYNKN